MKWLILVCVMTLAACSLGNEMISPDAAITNDGGVPGCDAAYCCTSAADIPSGLGCGSCGQDTMGKALCDHGVVVCDPALLGGNRHEVVVIDDWAAGIGDCVIGSLYPPDGGGSDVGNDPELVTHVEGQDDCYKFDFSVDGSTAYYGKEIKFKLVLTNRCADTIDVHSGTSDWLTIRLYTHGVACCPSRESLPAGQHVAILPMDGWDAREWGQPLLPYESISMTLSWHPEDDNMVNPVDAPEGLYDAYALPPTIVRDAGDWHGPLSKFLVVRVVKQQ